MINYKIGDKLIAKNSAKYYYSEGQKATIKNMIGELGWRVFIFEEFTGTWTKKYLDLNFKKIEVNSIGHPLTKIFK